MDIDVQYALDDADIDENKIPSATDFIQWAGAALTSEKDDAQMSIRIVDKNEISELNKTYRHKNGPTNVLSFPADLAADIPLPLLGDVIICAPVVYQEAIEQNKSERAHWAHLTIHGTLHLLGYEHDNETTANLMESREINIMNQLGFDNPYQ